ncbi:MAG: anti-sigma factor family protein [Acidimicrobiales bacterium]
MTAGGGAHLGDLTSALVDGQLGPEEEAAALGHLASCPPCAADLRSISAVRAMVRSLGPVEPPYPLVAGPPVRHRPSWASGLVAAAAASVALLLLSGVEQPTNGGPQVAQLVQVHSTSPVNVDPMSQLAPAVLPASLEQ